MQAQEFIESFLETCERNLLEPGLRESSLVQELLAESFVEFGSSGRIFTKSQIVESLRNESPVEISASDFKVRLLSPGIALVTYRTERHSEPPVSALRSSIWTQGEGGWKMVFHQGTLSSQQT